VFRLVRLTSPPPVSSSSLLTTHRTTMVSAFSFARFPHRLFPNLLCVSVDDQHNTFLDTMELECSKRLMTSMSLATTPLARVPVSPYGDDPTTSRRRLRPPGSRLLVRRTSQSTERLMCVHAAALWFMLLLSHSSIDLSSVNRLRPTHPWSPGVVMLF